MGCSGLSNQLEFSALMPCDSEFLYRWHTMPRAINRLIPPWENILVVKHPPSIIDKGKVHIKVDGLIDWHLEINDVQEGKCFSDKQIKGPLLYWTHKHSMQAINESSSLLVERISFKLPLLDSVLNQLITKIKLKPIFDYRFRTMLNDIKIHYKYKNNKSMKILISGSSGLVGSALVDFLSSGGHQVYKLVRSQTREANEIYYNSDESDLTKLEGFDAVIHLAGENIAGKRWTTEQKQKIKQSRIDGTSSLAQALTKLKSAPQVFICASAIGYYNNSIEPCCDESSPAGEGFLADTCKQWEQACMILKGKNIRVVNTRFGIILDPKSGALAKILPIFSLGAGGRLGNGNQWMSWVALDDVLGVILHCLNNNGIRGPVNVVAPNPVTNNEFTEVLSKVLNRPAIFPVPSLALKIVLGEMSDELLLSSLKISSKVLKETGYDFAYPDLNSALKHMLGKP